MRADGAARSMPTGGTTNRVNVRAVACVLACGAALTACGHQGTAGFTGDGHVPKAGEPAIFICDSNVANARPVTVPLSCANPNAFAQHFVWSTWSTSGSSAEGIVNANTCVPDCQSGPFVTYMAHFQAQNLKTYFGQQYYTSLVATFDGPGPGGAATLTYALPTPQGAPPLQPTS